MATKEERDKKKKQRLAGGAGGAIGGGGDSVNNAGNTGALKSAQTITRRGIEKGQNRSLGAEISEGFNDIKSNLSPAVRKIDTSRPSDSQFTETSPGVFSSGTDVRKGQDRLAQAKINEVNNAEDLRVIKEQIANNPSSSGLIDRILNARIPIQSGGTKGSLGDFASGNPEGAVGSVLNAQIPIQSGGSRGSLAAFGRGAEVNTDPAATITQASDVEPIESEGARRQRQLLGEGTTAQPVSDISPNIDESKAGAGAKVGEDNVIFGNTEGTANSVDFGSPEANLAAAERFRSGKTRGSFNVIPSKSILETSRLNNARSAVAKLKAGGASASAQLEAFKRISKGGEVDRRQALSDQFQNAVSKGDDLGAREISRSIDRFDNQEQLRKESGSKIENDRLGEITDANKVQATLRDESVKFDKDTNTLLRDLVKVDSISGKSLFDLPTRSDQVTRRLQGKEISSNLFQSLFPDFFPDGINNDSLDSFRADPNISDDLKLKARDALIAQQSRR